MTTRKIAWVFGGGGSRGALQAGAIRALLETDQRPDFLVGTSIGAVNAAFLGLHGLNLEAVDALEQVWREASRVDLMPANKIWLTKRVVLDWGRRDRNLHHDRIHTFMMAHGISPDSLFGELKVPVFAVATDLNSRQIIVYGDEPNDNLFQAVKASAALPPWVLPLERDAATLVDGGVVSNLPLEPAMARGATEIVALDLLDAWDVAPVGMSTGSFFARLLTTAQLREMAVELALAEARGVPVRRLVLAPEKPVSLWDFSQTDALIAHGYAAAREQIARWQPVSPPRLPKFSLLQRLMLASKHA